MKPVALRLNALSGLLKVTYLEWYTLLEYMTPNMLSLTLHFQFENILMNFAGTVISAKTHNHEHRASKRHFDITSIFHNPFVLVNSANMPAVDGLKRQREDDVETDKRQKVGFHIRRATLRCSLHCAASVRDMNLTMLSD